MAFNKKSLYLINSKIIEQKNTLFKKEEKAETLKELSNKLDNIEKKADQVYENVKKKKDKNKKNNFVKMRKRNEN